MLALERHGPTPLVRLAHGKASAMDLELLHALRGEFERLSAAADVRAVVLTGSGAIFSAGVELKRLLAGGRLPAVPVRQWVLTLPFGLRFAVAFDRELCRAVRGVFIDTVLAELHRRARRQGVSDGRSGAVVCVQRFGGALNLNVHVHALVLDGVFQWKEGQEKPAFLAARRLSEGDLADILQAVRVRVLGLLRRRGVLPDGEPSALEDLAASLSTLAGLQADSIAGRHASRVGQLPGTPFVEPTGRDCVADDGFFLHAGVCVPGGPFTREPLERLCRSVARPALASERLSELPDGRIAYELRRPWSDGTSRIVLQPLVFLAKLAALVPPPRAHQRDVPRRAGAGVVAAAGDRAGGTRGRHGHETRSRCLRRRPDAPLRPPPVGGADAAGFRAGRAALPLVWRAAPDPGGDHAGPADPGHPRVPGPAERGAGGGGGAGLARTPCLKGGGPERRRRLTVPRLPVSLRGSS